MSTPIVLPDFTRIVWRSPVIQEWYEPLVQSFSNAFLELERLSVAEGIRDAAWQFVSTDSLVPLTQWCADHHLILIPVESTVQSLTYAASASTRGNPAYRCVIVRPEHYQDVLPFVGDEKIGRWLGYPECCRKHFARTWGAGSVDNTYEQMRDTDWTKATWASTLWRWMGVRLVAHLPCSYSCEASDGIARDLLTLGDKYGYVEEMALAKELLAMPVTLSRVFGISEITSPIAKIVTRTDWSPTMERAEKSGTYSPVTSDLWKHNGFASASGMRAGHAPLLSALVEHVPQGARVLDLGCGNGLLLRRLKQRRPDVKVAGIDLNEDAIASIPPLTGTFWTGRIEDCRWKPYPADVVLLNPVRLKEMTSDDAATVRGYLTAVRATLVVYAYSDCVQQLESLVRETGLGEVEMLTKLPEVAVGLIRRA